MAASKNYNLGAFELSAKFAIFFTAMAITKIDINTFLNMAADHLVLDVRSEGEFAHARHPEAASMPLFNNEERKVVGTAYKQQSKQQAIKIGLDMFGKKMVGMVETVEQLLTQKAADSGRPCAKTVIVYCWRGGMRSGGVGWLLDLYGYKVYTLAGGYKTFRRWALQQLEKDYPLQILGGYTGSGKTYVLQALKEMNKPVIDLEKIAAHKGSAFGSIGMPPQPSQEMFENLLALQLHRVSPQANNPAWIEDESQRIGLVNIPATFFRLMRCKPVYFLDIPFAERVQHIVQEYGGCDTTELVNATRRIQKRLGGLETANVVDHVEKNEMQAAFSILLRYYDKHYLKGLHTRANLSELLQTIPCEHVDAFANAQQLIHLTTGNHANI